MSISYQQKLVYERLYANYEKLLSSNDKVSNRAATTMLGSSGIVTIAGSANLLANSDSSLFSNLMMVLALLCTSVMFLCFLVLSTPWKLHFPGPTDTDELYDDYLVVDPNTAYNNALSDLSKAMELAIKTNREKAKLLTAINLIAAIQIFFLAAGIADINL